MVKAVNIKIETKYYIESSLLNWYPKIRSVPSIKIPETKVFKADKPIDKIANNIKDFLINKEWSPAFLRTDQLSDKHNFIDTCFIDTFLVEEIKQKMIRLVEKHEMIIPPLPVSAFVVRRYYTPKVYFHAFKGLPIAPERRFIISNHKIIADFPYWWASDMFVDKYPHFHGVAMVYYEVADEIEDVLKRMNSEDYSEAKEQVRKIADMVDGNWSVDAMLTLRHGWMIIDMARAEVSAMPKWAKDKLLEVNK